MNSSVKSRRNHYLTLKLTALVDACLETRFICDEIEWLNFWPFISQFTHRNIKAQIGNLNQIKTDVGRSRAWLRLTLNDGLLSNYINAICNEISLVKRYYHSNAYLLDVEQMDVFRTSVANLCKLPFNLPVNAVLLNAWTETPLKYAGYSTDGKIALPKDEQNRILFFDRSSGMISVEAIDENEDVELASEALDDNEQNSVDAFLECESLCTSEFSSSTVASCSSKIHAPKSINVIGRPLFPGKNDSFTYPDSESRKSSPCSTFTDRKLGVDNDGKLFDERFMQILNAVTPSGPVKNVLVDNTTKNERTLKKIHEENTKSERMSEIKGPNDSELKDQVIEIDPQSRNVLSHKEEFSDRSSSQNGRCSTEIESDPVSSSESQTIRPDDEEDHGADADQSSSGESEANALGSPYPHGNSLLGKRGWSCGALAFQNNNDQSETPTNQIFSTSPIGTAFSSGKLSNSLLRQNSTEEPPPANFTETVYRVFNSTISKFVIITNETTEGVSGIKDRVVGCTDSPLQPLDEKSSGFIDSSSPEAACKADKNSCLESVEESAERYILVEKPWNNLEPAENVFRNSCLTKFSHEVGLSDQDFKCFCCRKGIGLLFGPYRICEFDGRYYCSECHLNEESAIPYRVAMNWDFKTRKVCRASKAFLDFIADQPLLKLDDLNPYLIDVVQRIAQVRKLRLQLSFAAMYLLTCRETVADDFKKRVYPKEYYYEDVDLYSLNDFKKLSKGLLAKQIKSLIDYTTKHILKSCRLCANKAYLCEICHSQQGIYPFQFDIAKRGVQQSRIYEKGTAAALPALPLIPLLCDRCYSVYHKTCWTKQPCPKCIRRRLHSQSTHDGSIDMLHFL
uniref:RUN domain-containing protein n=1 Tax=Romanomermis culicivorax TaxID=13658 RepID=A0A915K6M2_ROMCU